MLPWAHQAGVAFWNATVPLGLQPKRYATQPTDLASVGKVVGAAARGIDLPAELARSARSYVAAATERGERPTAKGWRVAVRAGQYLPQPQPPRPVASPPLEVIHLDDFRKGRR
jgi:hypothetical protein